MRASDGCLHVRRCVEVRRTLAMSADCRAVSTGNMIGNDGCQALKNSLHGTCLEALLLDGMMPAPTRLPARAVDRPCPNWRDHPSMRAKDNRIGDSGAEHVAKLVANSTALQRLGLAGKCAPQSLHEHVSAARRMTAAAPSRQSVRRGRRIIPGEGTTREQNHSETRVAK